MSYICHFRSTSRETSSKNLPGIFLFTQAKRLEKLKGIPSVNIGRFLDWSKSIKAIAKSCDRTGSKQLEIVEKTTEKWGDLRGQNSEKITHHHVNLKFYSANESRKTTVLNENMFYWISYRNKWSIFDLIMTHNHD